MSYYTLTDKREKAARVAAQTEKRHDSRKECFKLDSYTCRCCGKRFRAHAQLNAEKQINRMEKIK